jgi:hypothetical protein
MFYIVGISAQSRDRRPYPDPTCHGLQPVVRVAGWRVSADPDRFRPRYGTSIEYTRHSRVLFAQNEYSRLRIFILAIFVRVRILAPAATNIREYSSEAV